MKERIKKENSKAFGKFIVILIICTFAGGIVGFLSAFMQDGIAGILDYGVPMVLQAVEPYAIAIVTFITMGIGWVIYFQCKKALSGQEIEDEDILDRVEYRLNYPLLLCNICMIMAFFFFAVSIVFTDSAVSILSRVAVFMISVAITIVLQQKVVDLVKTINPEKKGSVYDSDFSRKWESSCDEAERLSIYKASYTSYKTTNMTCIALWVILTLISLIYQLGILPIVVVSIIWMVQTVSYCVAAMRLEKRKNQ